MADEEEHFGETLEYDPHFKGPSSVERSRTDVVFTVLFVVYIGLWFGVLVYSAGNSDLKKFHADKSSFRSQRCGYDPDVKNKPYLMFFDLSKCLKPIPATGCNTPHVCVEKCPDKPFLWDTVNRSSFNPNDLICQENINTPKTMAEAQIRIRNGECARYYLPSKAVRMRCLPLDNAVEHNSAISSHFNHALTTDVLKTNFKDTYDHDYENYQKGVEDLENCWRELLIYGIVALFVALLFVFLLKWFAGVITWGCLTTAIVFGVFVTYYCFNKYSTNANSTKIAWLIMAIFSSVSTAITLLIIIFLRKKIMLTIAIFEETSKSVLSNITSLLFPLLPWLLELVVFIFFLCVAAFIIAMDDIKYHFHGSQSSCKCTGEASGYKEGSICSPKLFASLCKQNGKECTSASCLEDFDMNYLHAINMFGFLWVHFILSAFEQMVLAGTFATWYFTFDKDDVPYFGILDSMNITTKYHTGTLVFGSIIVAIIRVIRFLFEYLNEQLRKGDSGDGNTAMQVCLLIAECCLLCVENTIKFINRNAYIMCAIHGTNFCTSAVNAYNLIMRNMLQIIVTIRVTTFVLLVSEVLISFIVMTLAYFISFSDSTAYHYNWLPVVIVGIISFLATTIFFNVFSMGVDTLFICFLQDLERNDGSARKPYYMSKNLMKVFNTDNE